jgi:uncharacterized membrane protein
VPPLTVIYAQSSSKQALFLLLLMLLVDTISTITQTLLHRPTIEVVVTIDKVRRMHEHSAAACATEIE